ncbi:aminopeptidase P family protein [Candidatus Dependentiae bacterium]|nr:aminopeptidase P family protein [Candidatus Dependentiae bacterium]
MQKEYSHFIQRRTTLLNKVKKAFPNKKGSIMVCAGFESARHSFEQDSSFYYLTGLEEPGVILLLNLDGTSTLYVPQYGTNRGQWTSQGITEGKDKGTRWGFNEVVLLGEACRGYSLTASCLPNEYSTLLADLQDNQEKGEVLFAEYGSKTIEQTLTLDRLLSIQPQVKQSIVDIAPLIASMRRIKDADELEFIYGAVDVTIAAHEWASTLIEPELFEYELQASLEFVFKSSGGSSAFPSIVASGRNSTVLHYTRNDQEMRKGDLVIIDIGARVDYYCADLARTYPISRTFTDRQREVYDVVLETQDYIAEIARPGYWITNKNVPEKSLQHLAVEFLKKRGYADYFNHLIGHFLGLDVHDVGDYNEPLKEGDVFTLEPGIYIPNERMGIRIEDNYWMTKNGVVCLSEELARDSYEIEEMMAKDLEE